MQNRRGLPLALLALVAYLFAGAFVPRGHMAAPLGSGTAFHLCPGDLRSAWIIDALAASAPQHAHAHHHAMDLETGAEGSDPTVKKSAADPGCVFSGSGGASAASDPADTVSPAIAGLLPRAAAPELLPVAPAWLRPPARSPPA